jgi:succinoglycan biosynthesis transport protein ExoP
MERAEIDIRQIFLTLKRHTLLIIGVISAACTIGAIHVYLATPLYTSTSLILFDPRDKNLLDPRSDYNAGTQASARVDSEVEFIRSDAVMLETLQQTPLSALHEITARGDGIGRRVLATLGFGDDKDASADEAVHSALSALRRATTVKRLGSTYIIAITAQSANPARAATIANNLAQTYIAAQVRHKVTNLDNHRTILARHLELARVGLRDADDQRDRLIKNNLTQNPDQTSDAEYQQAALTPELASQLDEIDHIAELTRAQYQNLTHRLQELTAQTDLQVADSDVISVAIAPLHPTSPNTALTLTLSGLAGLMAGIALALLYEHLIGGFATDEQIAHALNLKDATALPKARSRTDADSVAELVVDEPSSQFSEAMRRLRATIAFAIRPIPTLTDDGMVIMVCSATKAEGKTTLSVALARCFARSGVKTLLIDGDLRDPSVHHHLKIGPSLALVDQLARSVPETSFSSLISTDPLTPLSVITGADRDDISATDLLGGRFFELLIAKARSHFEVVIIDTSALGEFADALYVAPLAQVALLTTKWASTPQHAVVKTLQALRNAGQPSLLVIPVLTQQKERKKRPSLFLRRYGAEI